jgi:hypothetical protein
MSVVRCTVVFMARGPAGHIERLPSGSWRVKVYAGTDPLTGREIRLRKTCKTERASQIELGKLLEQAAAGRQPETNATVAELMDRYAEVADSRPLVSSVTRSRRSSARSMPATLPRRGIGVPTAGRRELAGGTRSQAPFILPPMTSGQDTSAGPPPDRG